MSDPRLTNRFCNAVMTPQNKCIRGRNGNMLVEFALPRIEGEQLARDIVLVVVPARRLRLTDEARRKRQSKSNN